MEQAKYKGVRKRKWGKWVSEIRLPNSRERIWLGSYNAPEKAARAFDVAQYCLRGPTARFNFPDDPPDVPCGRWLSSAEIQDVAAHSGNDYRLKPLADENGGGGNGDGVRWTGDDTHVVEINETSTSSTPGGGVQLEGIDWSFLDNLDAPFTSNDYFGLFHGDIYVPRNDYEIEYGDGESICHFSQQSFLWNF